MRKICVALLLAALTALAGAAWGATPKNVYLKDGGRIEAQSVWRKGETVYVLVNRDTLVELSQNEVDLKRTFAAAKKTVKKKKATPTPGAEMPAGAAAKVATPPPKAGEPAKDAAKPGAPPAPSAAKPETPPGAAKPGEKPAPPAPPQAAPEAPKPAPPAPPAPAPAPTVTPPPMPPEMPAAGMGMMLATMGMIPLVVAGLLLLLFIATFWKIFEKAGEAGWKSLVPFYNLFIMLRIAGKPWWWFLLFFVPLVNIIINLLWCLALAQKFGKSQLFGVGLFFLGFICFPILAFDKSTYQG